MFTAYILFSESKSKYYIGQTNNIDNRLHRHNSGQSLSTKPGAPWKLIYSASFETRAEAMALENKIKKRGAMRFLIDIDINNTPGV